MGLPNRENGQSSLGYSDLFYIYDGKIGIHAVEWNFGKFIFHFEISKYLITLLYLE